MATDNLTHDQALEKAEWIDKLRELGFVWDGNIDDQPNLSKWRHKNIGHFTARLALVTDAENEHNGHFVAIGLPPVYKDWRVYTRKLLRIRCNRSV